MIAVGTGALHAGSCRSGQMKGKLMCTSRSNVSR